MDIVPVGRRTMHWLWHGSDAGAHDWVLDLDIKGFFDNIDWELLMRAVRRHTDCRMGAALHRKMAEGAREHAGWHAGQAERKGPRKGQ